MDDGPVGDGHAGAEDDVGLDRDVAPDDRVMGEPDSVGSDEGDARRHHVGAPPDLPRGLDSGEFAAAVDARDFAGGGLDDAARAVGERDDIGEVIFARCIGVADAGKERPQLGGAGG